MHALNFAITIATSVNLHTVSKNRVSCLHNDYVMAYYTQIIMTCRKTKCYRLINLTQELFYEKI